jgi:hypothetical protein
MFERIIIVVFVLSLTLYITIYTLQRKRNAKIKQEALTLLNQKGSVSTEQGRHFFTVGDHKVELLFFYVPLYADLTINSKIIWEIKDSSKSRLVNQTQFLSSPHEKLIIIYPTQIVIKRFINENELVFVKYNEKFNQMYVLRANELKQFLDEDIL